MDNWKQAFWLAKFELKASKRSFVLLLFFSVLMTLYFISDFSSYLENGYVGFDLFFILMFTVAPLWARPKNFQVQQMGDGLITAPPVIMLQQLPIAEDIIVKNRFIIYFTYTAPIQILLLTSLYLFTPSIQEMMSVSTYLIFAIIWLSFGVYIGSMFSASDAGEKASSFKVAVYGILLIIGAIVVFTILHLILDYGLVHWTIIFAQKWPIPSALLSIFLAVIGFYYWQSYMKKVMGKLDYL